MIKPTSPTIIRQKGYSRWMILAGYLPLYLSGSLMLALLAVPLVLSLLVSFTPGDLIEVPAPGNWSLRWYERFFNDQIWQTGAVNSVLIALMTVVISLLAGTSAALAFERYDFPAKKTLNLFILLPLFVPPVILGMQNLAWHQRIGLWGSLLSLAIAHSLWAMPLVFTVMRASFRGVNRRLEEAALADRTFLTFGAQSFTYGEIDRQSNRVAQAMLELGLQPHDRVAFFLPNCPEFIFCWFATIKLNLVLVPVNTQLKGDVLGICH